MPAGRVQLALATVLVVASLAPSAAGDSTATPSAGLTIGVVPQRPYGDADTADMRDAGIRSVRAWFSWAQVERQRGDFNWGPVDQTVATNARAGLTTLPYLFGTPAWAAGLDGWYCEPDDCVRLPPRTDESRQGFAAFAAAAVKRYGPGGTFWRQRTELRPMPIEVWQIWNEPNLSSFWGPAVDPISYGKLVETAASAIRAVDPEAQILLAGLTGTKTNAKRMSSARFLNQLYTLPGVMDAFDGIAVHPYNRTARGTLAQVQRVRRIADAHGDDSALWVTELGWASAGKRRWGLVTSPEGQARKLRRALNGLRRNAARWNLRAAYWFTWRDTDAGAAVCGWCPWAGLIDRIGREKPAYEALRQVTSTER
jgi:hypothetical protein